MSIGKEAFNQMIAINANLCGDESAQTLVNLIKNMPTVSKETLIDCINDYFEVIYQTTFSQLQDSYYDRILLSRFKRSFIKRMDFNYNKNFGESKYDMAFLEELWVNVIKVIRSVIKNAEDLDHNTLSLAYELSLMFYNYYENSVNRNLNFDYQNDFLPLHIKLYYIIHKDDYRFIDSETNALRYNININMVMLKSKLKENRNN